MVLPKTGIQYKPGSWQILVQEEKRLARVHEAGRLAGKCFDLVLIAVACQLNSLCSLPCLEAPAPVQVQL